MPQATPISPEVKQLNETLAELRERTDRPYIDIPLVAHESCWVPIIGSLGGKVQASHIPLSKESVNLILRTRRGILRDELGNRATLRIKLRNDDQFL